MTAFTPDADARLEEYLAHVRAALAAAPDVDPAEVEADVREHIDAEFAGRGRVVSLAELEPVLARLGPPEGWAGGRPPGLRERLADAGRAARHGVRAFFRRVGGALWRGPEDWRLAYLTFGLFAFGVVVFPLFPALLVVSYILGRAGLAAAREKGIAVGAARKWLIYPPLVVVSLPLLLGVLAAPVLAGAGAYEFVESGVRMMKAPNWDRPHVRTPADRERLRAAEARAAEAARFIDPIPGPTDVKPGVAAAAAMVVAAAAWYGLLGALTWTFPRAPRAVFAPLLGWVEARHGRWVTLACAAVFLVCCALAYRYLGAVEVL